MPNTVSHYHSSPQAFGNARSDANLSVLMFFSCTRPPSAQALALIRTKWPNASPNEGFEAQLGLFQVCLWEKWVCVCARGG